MKEIFKKLDGLIKIIGDSDKEGSKILIDLKEEAFNSFCKADASKRDDILKKFKDAIELGKLNCPDKSKEYDEIEALRSESMTMMCGGG